MSTTLDSTDENCTADLGAQYITATPENYNKHESFYSELEDSGILQPLPCTIEGDKTHAQGTRHFIPSQGMGSLVKHFLDKADVRVDYNQKVCDITEAQGKWRVKGSNGKIQTSDCVILTPPVPDILQIDGTIQQILKTKKTDMLRKLQAVTYSSRYAVALFYNSGTDINFPWGAKYFMDDPIIRFIAINSMRKGIDCADVGSSVLVHTSVPFGMKHANQDTDSVCSNMILPRLRHILPQLPQPDRVHHHKWRCSQVYQPYEGQPGAIVINDNPLLVCGGDAFTQSGFDACIESASKLASIVLNRANTK